MSSETPKPRKKIPGLSTLFLGSHSRLYSEDHYLRAFAPHGLTRKGFRALLRALSVPVIHLGQSRMIDHLSFTIAMRAISRIGQPDFVAPGSAPIDRGRMPRARPSTTRLDPSYVRANLTAILAELIATRVDPASTATHASFTRAATAAVDRLMGAHFQSLPPAEQAAYAYEVLRANAPQLLHTDPSTPELQDPGPERPR